MAIWRRIELKEEQTQLNQFKNLSLYKSFFRNKKRAGGFPKVSPWIQKNPAMADPQASSFELQLIDNKELETKKRAESNDLVKGKGKD